MGYLVINVFQGGKSASNKTQKIHYNLLQILLKGDIFFRP